MELFNKEFLYVALSSGIITTFAVSAINTIQAKLSVNWLVFIVSIIVTVASISLSFSDTKSIQDFAIKVILTMSFSVLFYNYLGKWFLDTLFTKLKEIITSKLSKAEKDVK